MDKMVIGETRDFSIVPITEANVDLTPYTAKYEIVLLGEIKKTGIVPKSNDNTKFNVHIDTSNLTAGKHELRVRVINSIEQTDKCVYSEFVEMRK